MKSLRTFFRIRKRVKERWTRYNFLVILALFGLFLEAYMHNFNLVYITLFFIFAIAFVATPMGVLNIGTMEAVQDHTGRLFAQQMGYCAFVITNRSEQPSWAIELHCDEASTSLSCVAPAEKKRVLLPITPSKRGWLRSEACYLQSLFPLSTVRFIVPIAEPCRAIMSPVKTTNYKKVLILKC